MKTSMPVSREADFRYGIENESKYISTLKKYQNDRKDSAFMNDSLGHATLLADMMITSAEKNVQIYTGCLNRQCYEFALNNVPPNVDVHILFEKDDADKWWETIKGKKITAHQYKNMVSPLDNKPVNHFFIIDSVAFRYEIDDGDSTATASFNMPDVCRGLSSMFELAWNKTNYSQELLQASSATS